MPLTHTTVYTKAFSVITAVNNRCSQVCTDSGKKNYFDLLSKKHRVLLSKDNI